MNGRVLRIPVGGMYQEWQHLMDLVEEDTAKSLEELASKKDPCRSAGHVVIGFFSTFAL